MTIIHRILKSTGIILMTEVCILKAMVFSIILYACQSWTIKKLIPEELMLLNWCWRRLLRFVRRTRRSNQSILKKTSCEYSLERLRLKLQYFGA